MAVNVSAVQLNDIEFPRMVHEVLLQSGLFPIDKIKIDRSFITGCENQPKSQSLVKAIMTMGHALNIPVLAEGVETQSQLDFVRDIGCCHVQGYFFGMPCAEADMVDTEQVPPARMEANRKRTA